ncbi:MAG: ABC transporter ATP-binding protein [Pseudomonadota bacterium]
MSLHATNLTLGYSGRPVVRDLSFSFDLRQSIAIIGPNGCGKSTLLRGLLGLLPPLSGSIELDGKAIGKWNARALARRIAFLPQSPVAPEGLTVRQIVEHGRFAHQSLWAPQTKEDRRIVGEALARTGLSHLADRQFSTLSGGERQRGWIALALAQRADAVFFDEPTTFLDLGHQLDIMDLLRRLNLDHDIGILMVLHDVNHAACYADRVVALHSGRLIADGNGPEVITAGLMADLFGVRTEIQMLEAGGRRYPHCIPLGPENHAGNSAERPQ